MAKRVNYGYEKFQKENKRKKKQAEKLEKKRLKKVAENADGQVPPATDTPAVPVPDASPEGSA